MIKINVPTKSTTFEAAEKRADTTMAITNLVQNEVSQFKGKSRPRGVVRKLTWPIRGQVAGRMCEILSNVNALKYSLRWAEGACVSIS